MRNFYAKHMTALMQNKAQTPEPPIAVESSPQPPVQLRSNRRQRRFLTQDGRRLNGEINALATAGKPVTVRVGPDGKLHAVVDKKQLKQLEAQKNRKLTGEPEVIAAVSGGEMPELPPGMADMGLGPDRTAVQTIEVRQEE